MAEQQIESRRFLSSQESLDEAEANFLDYLRLTWRHRWMITLLCVLIVGLVVALTLTQPRHYQATAVIVPPVDILQKQAGLGGQLGGLGGSLLRDVMDSQSIGDIYVEILNSREVADAIIDQFSLMTVYTKVKYRSDAQRRLKKSTRIESTAAGAVKITVTDRDPNTSAAIANAYVEELDKRNKRLSIGQATSKRAFLENRLKDVEQKLRLVESITSREAQVQEMLYELLMRELELAKIEEAKSMPTIQVLDKAFVPEVPVRRGALKKGAAAGMGAFIFGLFLAFVREYVVQSRRHEAGMSVAAQTRRSSDLAPAAERAVGTS